jgi:membrane protease YdiL (CAAX protease family)
MAKRGELPEQLRVPWGIGQAILVFALVWIGLPVLIILGARILAPYVPFVNSFLEGLINGTVSADFVNAVIDAVAGLALVAYYLRKYKIGWSAVGWRKFNPWKALLVLVGVFAIFLVGVTVLLALVAALIPSFNANQPQTNDFTGSVIQNHRLIAILALVVIPPIIEETLFRGFIFPAFAKRWGTIVGAVCSSVLFGFAHLQANVSVYTFFLGLLLCYMYVKLRSVYPGMALHMINNYLALMALSGK